MREKLTPSVENILPDRTSVLQNQGIPTDRKLDRRIENLIEEAFELFGKLAKPEGVTATVSIAEFAIIYRGEGNNETPTPVGDIFGRAEHLALFAVTVGSDVNHKIGELFDTREFALGSLLDSVASAATDQTAQVLEYRFLEKLVGSGLADANSAVLRYSPGYCGWHISGQRRLFDFLQPGEIGISLRPSFLMEPLKSVSGVLIAGKPEIHHFIDSYSFCQECKNHSCCLRVPTILRE